MPRPAVTFSRNGTTSSGFSGPPKETSRRASYGETSGAMAPMLGSVQDWAGTASATYPRPEMMSSYRRILSRPGTALFSASGLLARLPISMVGLGIVLLVSAATGSYAIAGSVSAAYVLANGGFRILQGR